MMMKFGLSLPSDLASTRAACPDSTVPARAAPAYFRNPRRLKSSHVPRCAGSQRGGTDRLVCPPTCGGLVSSEAKPTNEFVGATRRAEELGHNAGRPACTVVGPVQSSESDACSLIS